MIVAVWRASARDFDLDRFLADFPNLRPGHVWHRGDTRLRKSPSEHSGFNKVLVEGDDFRDVMDRVGRQLLELSPALSDLRARSVSSVVDFGITMEVGRQVSRSVLFNASDIQLFERLGLDLEVSAYASSPKSDA